MSVDTEYSLTGLSLDDLVACITHCPLLEQLTLPITSASTRRAPQEIPPLIELCHLRDLTLIFGLWINPGDLFDILVLPKLTYLTSMLARSRPPLEQLSLSVPMTEATLLEVLPYIPSLEFLSYDGVASSTDTVLDGLTMDENEPARSLCPSLKNIHFASDHFSPDAMIAMVLSRRQSAKSIGATGTSRNGLERVCCGWFNFDNILSNPEIAACVDDGLKFVTGHDSSVPSDD